MLQVWFWLPGSDRRLHDGAPTALGSIIAKSTVTQVLRRLGYRKTLVGITVFIGLMIAQFFRFNLRHADLDARTAAIHSRNGDVHSIYGNECTVLFADLTDDNASSGNSVLAVTQQLSISLGVAISAAGILATMKVLRAPVPWNSSTIPLSRWGDRYRVALMFMLLRAKTATI
ncbi:hypothetical protein KCP69_02720 [Salmonella enterica subsp. enterica]|nr:hypothetical protein KCP69_02720 [Salmonella enterica subsp. enterica]